MVHTVAAWEEPLPCRRRMEEQKGGDEDDDEWNDDPDREPPCANSKV